MTSKFDRQVSKALGVTPCGLQFLARLVANGKAPQRSNEATTLERNGFIVETEVHGYRNWETAPWVITDAGRDVVKRARAMGW